MPALEFGLLQSQGKYISRMDSDDMMPVKRLEQMRNALLKSGEKNGCDRVGSVFFGSAGNGWIPSL
ncbi:hypothetical protein [Algoriphagus boritolerans]|uniref:hypothetical protein n=1 Tax=Algoriphagus boritolerans TaxID=308111 RepID=UPI003A101D79